MLWLHSGQGVTLLCRMLALIPLYFVGKLLVGARNSFWALLILLVLPYPAQFGSEVLREWPHVLFLSLGFWLLCLGLRRQQWWLLALVGLDTGLAYLIRPENIQLVLYAFLGLASVSYAAKMVRPWTLWGVGSLLMCFLAASAPHIFATGSIRPAQFQAHSRTDPPIIRAIGSRAPSDDPLEFEVAEGELLELPVVVVNSQGGPMTFSLARAPVGSRPVYQFWTEDTGDFFWTLQAEEGDHLLSEPYPRVWNYGSIAYYAYTRADAHPGLRGVHQFWSPTRRQHFFTMDEQEKQTILSAPTAAEWLYEGVAFYAFGESNRPPDAVPVYRHSGWESGYFWEVEEPGIEARPENGTRRGTLAWYVHAACEPPAGARIEDGVFRWQPSLGQRGDYEVNIIIGSEGLQSCQLVGIKVTEARIQGHGINRSVYCAARAAVLEKPPEAIRGIFASVAEDLMVVFSVPWLLGLYWRLRYQAARTERVLIVAVVIANIVLMLWRHLNLGPGEDRRYCLGMITLTIFYVPVGIEVMAQWLNSIHPLPRPRWMPPSLPGLFWFYLLLAVGITTCLPKLLMASPGNKEGYRAVSAWLQQNTKAEDVLAVPDIRISFYAQRQGLLYVQYPNLHRADYVVVIDDGRKGQPPEGWRREYSAMTDRRTRKTLIIYSTTRSK